MTNRWLALPIFIGIMFLVFALSVGKSVSDGGISIGTFMTDWMNDTFGEASVLFFNYLLIYSGNGI